jgi:hypothetical protein
LIVTPSNVPPLTTNATPLLVTRVAPRSVPLESVSVVSAWNVLETVSDPPESTNACWHWTLLTTWMLEEWVTVMLGPGPITTSSLVPGSAPVLQFVAVFQSPLPPVQDTVAARASPHPPATRRAQAKLSQGAMEESVQLADADSESLCESTVSASAVP